MRNINIHVISVNNYRHKNETKFIINSYKAY